MEESITTEDGHYSIAVPFRQDVKSVPNNRVQAERRLACLAKKLQRNPALKEAYIDGMRSLIKKRYAEKLVDGTQMEKGAEWYIPHHTVANENKKICIVFCAAKCDGVGLNDAVLQGPDLTNGLLGVPLSFCQYPVAVSADVGAMFHQVKLAKRDQDVLRFLWWPASDPGAEPETYCNTVHLFGGTWESMRMLVCPSTDSQGQRGRLPP